MAKGQNRHMYVRRAMNGDGDSNDGIMHNGFKHYLGSLQEKSLFTKAIFF